MKTFDYEQVQAVLSPIRAKLQACAHPEGDRCATLDKHLDCCAEICLEVHQAVVAWARDVFAGRVVFDAEAEALWRSEIANIYVRARGVWQVGRRAEVPCWELPGQTKLDSALWHLSYLLQNWVTPKPSVAPSPRAGLLLGEATRAAMRQQLASLPEPAGQSRLV
jgi:hypothetical protein